LTRLVCLLLALSVPLTLGLFAFALPPQYSETYLGGLALKLEALDKAPSPRIVVIGGSGAAFNTCCDLLEEAFPGYTAVNLGLYAGLGTTVMLDLALPRLREGDVVVFSPELNTQTLSDWFGAEAMWQAADGHPGLLTALAADRWGVMAAAFPAFAGSAHMIRVSAAHSPSAISSWNHHTFRKGKKNSSTLARTTSMGEKKVTVRARKRLHSRIVIRSRRFLFLFLLMPYAFRSVPSAGVATTSSSVSLF
jgi:hypothetical protein